LERALFFAAHFDRSDLVPLLIERLEGLLAEPAATAALEARSRLIGQSLRSLRKCGLRDLTERLLERLHQAIERAMPSGSSVRLEMERARMRLHLAAGWLATDQGDRAWPILDSARQLILAGGASDVTDHALYVSLVSTYIAALASAPLDRALDRVEELFANGRMHRLPNSFTTAPFYSRFHLNIVEAVVLALANEEFALGPAARRWLDDDEFLIRRRIHRDVRMALDKSDG
jgi:hypothetical protein